MITKLGIALATAATAVLLSVGTAHADCVQRCWQNGNQYQCQNYCS